MEYPEYGEKPAAHILTACETLCWIGYRRAIPKDTYFSPYEGPAVKLETHFNDSSFLHRAIPGRKPEDDPMEDAEFQLLAALRDGSIGAFYLDKETGKRRDLPSSVLQCDVTISARGSLEPDWRVVMEKYMIASTECKNIRGALYFLRDEILVKWPLPTRETDHEITKSIAAETAMQKWLEAQMRELGSSPKSRNTIKSAAFTAGLSPISDRAFVRAWTAAIKATGAVAWSKAGRRKQSPHP